MLILLVLVSVIVPIDFSVYPMGLMQIVSFEIVYSQHFPLWRLICFSKGQILLSINPFILFYQIQWNTATRNWWRATKKNMNNFKEDSRFFRNIFDSICGKSWAFIIFLAIAQFLKLVLIRKRVLNKNKEHSRKCTKRALP